MQKKSKELRPLLHLPLKSFFVTWLQSNSTSPHTCAPGTKMCLRCCSLIVVSLFNLSLSRPLLLSCGTKASSFALGYHLCSFFPIFFFLRQLLTSGSGKCFLLYPPQAPSSCDQPSLHFTSLYCIYACV